MILTWSSWVAEETINMFFVWLSALDDDDVPRYFLKTRTN